MRTMRLLPTRASVLAATPNTRDRAIDVARLGSLVVVMLGHCVLLLATVTDGRVWIGNTLGMQPSLHPLTWLLQVMPLFFFAGAASSAYGIKPDTNWGSWLFGRSQRLARPVFWYLAFWVLALVGLRLAFGDSSAMRIGQESVALLWFIGVYLVVLAFVPVLVRHASARGFAVVVVALIALSAGFDAARLRFDALGWGYPNFLLIWLIPVVIGVAYARKLITRSAAAWIGALAFAGAVAAVAGPYDLTLVVTGNERFSNTTPPTMLLGLHCVWVSMAFVLAAPAISRFARRGWVWYPVAIGNGGAMTLYLWHIPAIAVAVLVQHYVIGTDAYDPGQQGFWGLMLLRACLFAAVMVGLFLLLSPLEHRKLPWWDTAVRASGVRGLAMGVLVCVAGVAVLLMAKKGLGTLTGWEALAGFVLALLTARSLAQPVDALQQTGRDDVPSTVAAADQR